MLTYSVEHYTHLHKAYEINLDKYKEEDKHKHKHKHKSAEKTQPNLCYISQK